MVVNSHMNYSYLVLSMAAPFSQLVEMKSLGGCNRCQMINLDPLSGHAKKSREPLATLASFRRVHGKILFGILLRYERRMEETDDTEIWLHVGQEVCPDKE